MLAEGRNHVGVELVVEGVEGNAILEALAGSLGRGRTCMQNPVPIAKNGKLSIRILPAERAASSA